MLNIAISILYKQIKFANFVCQHVCYAPVIRENDTRCFFIGTSRFWLRLDVLFFQSFSASDVLINVLDTISHNKKKFYEFYEVDPIIMIRS